MANDQQLTTNAAAEITGMTRGTISRNINEGKLEGVKIQTSRGGRGEYRIKRDDLDQWASKRSR